MKQDFFDADDLEKVEGNFVILNSGGPLLDLVCIEGDNALVGWIEDGKKVQRLLPIACLSKLVPLKKENK